MYFDPVLHRALWVKAAETERSMSALVNEAIQLGLAEDEEDLAALQERVSEPGFPSEDIVKTTNGVEKYRVSIKRSAVKESEAILQRKERQRIVRRIGEMADNPRPAGSKKAIWTRQISNTSRQLTDCLQNC